MINFEEKNFNGCLVPINNKDLPFEIKRIFYIYNIPCSVTRGNHGNRYTKEILICLNGTCEVTLDTYIEKKTYFLSKKNEGLFINNNTWITFKCSEDCIILVLCDNEFMPDERISCYEEIKKIHMT